MNQDKQIIESFKGYLPIVKTWINDLLNKNVSESKPITEHGFRRLPQYYSKDILESAKVVITNKPPQIPLSSMGLTQFKDFENLDIAGVTYLDTFFVRSEYAHIEAIHFHELVHVVQWKYLGIDKFLLMYGLGLMKYGYKNSPLEVLAHKLQADFENTNESWNAEERIIPLLDEMANNLFD